MNLSNVSHFLLMYGYLFFFFKVECLGYTVVLTKFSHKHTSGFLKGNRMCMTTKQARTYGNVKLL